MCTELVRMVQKYLAQKHLILFFFYSINVFVSSWKADDTSSREMFENISQSLDDMDTLIQSNTAKL